MIRLETDTAPEGCFPSQNIFQDGGPQSTELLGTVGVVGWE